MVKSKDQIDQNIIKKKFDLVDARSKDRFYGTTPDPWVWSCAIKTIFASCIN